MFIRCLDVISRLWNDKQKWTNIFINMSTWNRAWCASNHISQRPMFGDLENRQSFSTNDYSLRTITSILFSKKTKKQKKNSSSQLNFRFNHWKLIQPVGYFRIRVVQILVIHQSKSTIVFDIRKHATNINKSPLSIFHRVRLVIELDSRIYCFSLFYLFVFYATSIHNKITTKRMFICVCVWLNFTDIYFYSRKKNKETTT